ncbi:hypothetical protein G7054_g5061 [Neopestalotiopsis clavispora]|nr:hypothetical protein G7054_g5061 [Neopestalotiopsis clavispora]
MVGPVKQLQIMSVVTEVVVTSITLALFCCAYPDEFRSVLWEAGGENAWNSNPRLRIYDYANHREPPPIPLIWSQSLTNSNLAVALLAAAICLARIALLFFDFGGLTLQIMYDVVMSGMWMYSVVAQSSPDFTDPTHPSPRPWYLERGCGGLQDKYYKACVVTVTSFAFSIISLILDNGADSLRVGLLKYHSRDRSYCEYVERWSKSSDAARDDCLSPHAIERPLLARSRTDSFDTGSTCA